MSREKTEICLLLFNRQKGKCYYCSRDCTMGYNIRNSSDAQNNPSLATIEHLYPKLDLRRLCTMSKTFKRRHKDKVMACYECNQRMNERYLVMANDFYPPKHEVKGLLIDIYNGLYANQIII